MAAQENHLEVVRYLLESEGNQSIATEVCLCPSENPSVKYPDAHFPFVFSN